MSFTLCPCPPVVLQWIGQLPRIWSQIDIERYRCRTRWSPASLWQSLLALALAGWRSLMIGTDYPFPWNKVAVDHVLSIPELSDDDHIAIPGRTAAKLPGINCVKSGRRLHL